MHVGIVKEPWRELPHAGVRVAPPFDCATIDAAHSVDYVPHERAELEQLLMTKARSAIFVEAWGEFYIRAHVGIHQVHSRRASFAVPRDVVGRDGAIRFYFAAAQMSELLLFKFAGQP